VARPADLREKIKIMEHLISVSGFIVFCLIAWGMSRNSKKISWRTVVIGIVLQLLIAVLVFLVPASRSVFLWLSNIYTAMIEASREGIIFVFGSLGMQQSPQGLVLAFQVLPFIVIFAALMAMLYYLKVIPFIIRLIAKFIFQFFKVSGAESLCAASNIFVGIESTTTIRPYLSKLTRSELFLVLVAGMSTVASSVMAVYVAILGKVFPTIAGHLMSASILSIPAAVVICKLMEPETGTPETSEWKKCKMHGGAKADSLIEAVLNGSNDGAKLATGVAIMLISFIGLLGILKAFTGYLSGDVMCLEQILSWIFYPFAWLLGIPANEVPAAAQMLGKRFILTEIPAYLQLAEFAKTGNPRSVVIISYALCGFAHVASLAIFVGGIGALAPERKSMLAKIALRALIAATLVTLMTGAVAGIFCTGSSAIL
jgi:CNT family concentrative nucleoside transporter